MAEVTVTKTIKVDADTTWNAIRAIGGLDRWFPIITSCEVKGSGAGARRTCILDGGITLLEQIDSIDDQARVLKYSIVESPLPITDYKGRVEVRAAGQGRSSVTWSSAFGVDGAQESELTGMLDKAFSDGIAGLEADLRRAR